MTPIAEYSRLAAAGHRGDRGPGDEQLSGHVGLKEAIEVGLGDGFQRSEVLDPGVADRQIQAAEPGFHRAGQLVGLRRVTDIGRESRAHPLSRSSPTSASAAARSDR
jgi:hypothetical protein